MNNEIISSLVRHGFTSNDNNVYVYGKHNHAYIEVTSVYDRVYVRTMSPIGIPVMTWDCGEDDIDDFEDYIRSVLPVR